MVVFKIAVVMVLASVELVLVLKDGQEMLVPVLLPEFKWTSLLDLSVLPMENG
jgi:hypothetical protein